MNLANKTAVLTGAGSGIGRGLALVLAKRGCHLALVDKDADGLEETARLLAGSGCRMSLHCLDLLDSAAVSALPAAVLSRHGSVDLLLNNAGVAAGGTFAQVSKETFDWVMDTNFTAVVRLSRLFLPLLLQRPEACIVNMSSVFGLVAPAGQTAYAASKFAVRGFSIALRQELQETGVRVIVVHPGGIATRIAENARLPEDVSPDEIRTQLQRIKNLLRLPPEKAGEAIVRGIEQDRPRILVGRDARLLSLVERLLPVRYPTLLHWVANRRR